MDNHSISNTIFSIAHSYRLTMRSALKANELGLNSMHVKCLSYIHNSEACTANDIVQFLGRDKAQIARLVKEMISNNWLTKTANPEDKRSQFLSLTEEGQALAALIADTQSKVSIKMKQNLSDEELKEFSRIAGVISNNLRK
ncbi:MULTISPECIES: MarR family winged helix-turn-helix transcriptional regulator [unclassified Agarivorans]|uniref:MarR family winged helix-turn-helix transcriptional regulator n=1 Tax=unclassified Agarivorans TaxID=2636026 RepID=UPI0026E2BA16|nr:MULTISPECIES: MarR family transcriptional regulator [unclassified Agarivorans]MDO6685365.1 MarR family transcriptional regulator [Agarivorans sp. 3_MG-2023]MDO6715463.1 MarR family transcriptional regulator [Agarivorans sp. 2_MG-2023]